MPFLRKLTITMDLNPGDRDMLSAFLSTSNGQGYAPQSGEITGLLHQMKDTMDADLADATAKEEEAIKAFDAMSKAKTKEFQALTDEIESKTVRHGEAKVELVNLKADLSDTQEALLEDKKFLEELDKSCATKEGEWAERQKIRAEEMLAIHETIKILNDDDALELFKKTLPGASLLQMQVAETQVRQSALDALHRHSGKDFRLDFIALSLRGKKVSFDKVIKMIDDMVALLGKEQVTDDEKKAQCGKDIDTAEDEVKELEYAIKTVEANIEDATAATVTLTEEIAA